MEMGRREVRKREKEKGMVGCLEGVCVTVCY